MSEFQDLIGQALRFWFPSSQILKNYRPVWLFGMEIDFFLPAFDLAIEVQGRQHYLFTPKMQATVKDYQEQRLRDRRKQTIICQRGLHFVSISTFKGVQTKLRHVCPGRKFPNLPPKLRDTITDYCQMRDRLVRESWVSVKVKRDGTLIGTNKASTAYLKEKDR